MTEEESPAREARLDKQNAKLLCEVCRRICEEEIGPDVNVSIFFRLLEDTCVGDWNAQAE